MRIAIYGRPFNLDVLPYVQEVFDNLSQHGVDIYVHHQLSDYLNDKIKIVTYHVLGSDVKIKGFIDLFITLGGDGTLLDMVSVIRNTGVPVIGINFGRLGFLATINKSDIAAAIFAVVNKDYSLDSRDLISINSENEVFGDDNFALNDITIHKRDDAAMIITRVYMDNEFLNAYWGDGIIISTPTGSTAYSLSCGGPIIFPQSNSLVLTPVSPHNLNVRPVVLPDSSTITFEVESRSSNYLVSCDSRTATIDKTMRFSVQKAGFQLNLVRLNNESYLSTLRNKLLWGLDVRNY
ncbi:NAD+ kinase [Mucilaginibacter mallensis]|uniref:NAD kinase n=1 Tax=Mucilaginibacter mallensis TaxID=652787 RepID=A0A1H2A403_MUCMA|nr:NAD kinase [Mucilaginibacter mallensis]SDT40695.1 NAD+ kinase [Mucilaginibacter mallensis]